MPSGTSPVWGGAALGTSGRWEDVEKGYRKLNILQMLCTHVCKWKNETCWNYSRNGGKEGIKENNGGDEFKYDIFGML
jgi:hypothetical protein